MWYNQCTAKDSTEEWCYTNTHWNSYINCDYYRDLTYKNYIYNSEWSYCPIVRYEILDTLNNALINNKIFLQNP